MNRLPPRLESVEDGWPTLHTVSELLFLGQTYSVPSFRQSAQKYINIPQNMYPCLQSNPIKSDLDTSNPPICINFVLVLFEIQSIITNYLALKFCSSALQPKIKAIRVMLLRKALQSLCDSGCSGRFHQRLPKSAPDHISPGPLHVAETPHHDSSEANSSAKANLQSRKWVFMRKADAYVSPIRATHDETGLMALVTGSVFGCYSLSYQWHAPEIANPDIQTYWRTYISK